MKNLVTSAIKAMCMHKINTALTDRLCSLGEPVVKVLIFFWGGRKFLGHQLREKATFDKEKAVFLTHYHGVSHNLKKVGSKFIVRLAFRNDCRVS